MTNNVVELPVRRSWDPVLEQIARDKKRLAELEALCADGRATRTERRQLKYVRQCIEDGLEHLDILGYYNP